jgi:replicative DNA helicase
MPTKSHVLNGGRHLAPVAPLPSAADLLVCALLYSDTRTVLQIAEYVDSAADLDEPARSGYRAVVALAGQDIAPAPQLVLDELRRTGTLDRQTACWLATATTAGAPPQTARRYAALVVANSLRRQVNSFGTALINAAETAAEDELKVTIDIIAPTISAIFGRLSPLRGDADE